MREIFTTSSITPEHSTQTLTESEAANMLMWFQESFGEAHHISLGNANVL